MGTRCTRMKFSEPTEKKCFEYNLCPSHNFRVKAKNISDLFFLSDSLRSRGLQRLLCVTMITAADTEGRTDEKTKSRLLMWVYNSTISPRAQWETKFALPRKPRPNCRQWLSKGSHFVSLTALPCKRFTHKRVWRQRQFTFLSATCRYVSRLLCAQEKVNI